MFDAVEKLLLILCHFALGHQLQCQSTYCILLWFFHRPHDSPRSGPASVSCLCLMFLPQREVINTSSRGPPSLVLPPGEESCAPFFLPSYSPVYSMVQRCSPSDELNIPAAQRLFLNLHLSELRLCLLHSRTSLNCVTFHRKINVMTDEYKYMFRCYIVATTTMLLMIGLFSPGWCRSGRVVGRGRCSLCC